MSFIDAHCDALSKLLQHPKADFFDSSVLTVTLPRLQQGGALLQFFAIYIPEVYSPGNFELVLRSVDRFNERILSCPEMKPIRSSSDLHGLIPGRRIGALLSLEGVDSIPNDPMYIRILFELGLRAVGLTWNHATWAADGAKEPRKGGLTSSGQRLVNQCESLGILVDVSHLSERSFWDVAQIAKKPYFASHSNAKEVCPNVRNLSKQQIESIVNADGCIGLNFVPYFIKPSGIPNILDLLTHIDYICGIGGSMHLGFGSDFDGVDTPLQGLEHPGKFGTLREVLLKRYSEVNVEHWMTKNWLHFLHRTLPA